MPESGDLNLAAIALGSNLGNREQNLRTAIEHIRQMSEVVAVSGFLDTAPVGFLDQPHFPQRRAAAANESAPPRPCCAVCLAIELAMGRDRAAVPAKGPRIIDLDLLFYGDVLLSTPELTLPHPAMHERAFVLAPLAEIAPAWLHPHTGLSVEAMLQRLPLS